MIIDIVAAAGGAAFDPDLATRAYLDSLTGPARARSDAYFEGGYWLLLWGMLVSLASAWIMLRFGWSASWSRWAQPVTRRRWLQPALYAPPFVLISSLIVPPWTIYTDWYREKQYELMNLGFGGWLGEQVTGLGVTLVVTVIALVIIFAVIRAAPRSWWLWATARWPCSLRSER